jgi:hypothetical protein
MQQHVMQHGMIERIRANQLRRKIVSDDPERGEPACIGDASPIPTRPSSQWIRIQALHCAGRSSGAHCT